MGESWVIRKIEKLMRCVAAGERFLEIDRVMPQMIPVACDQKAGRQGTCDIRVIRVGVRGKCPFLVVLTVEVARKKKTDLVKTRGIKHAADQSERAEFKRRRCDVCCLCHSRTVSCGGTVDEKTGASAVTDGIHTRRISVVGDDPVFDEIHRVGKIGELFIEFAVRDQTVLDAVYKKSQGTESGAEEAVEFFAAEQKPAAVDVDDDRQDVAVTVCGAKDIQTVRFNLVVQIADVLLFDDAFRERKLLIPGCRLFREIGPLFIEIFYEKLTHLIVKTSDKNLLLF